MKVPSAVRYLGIIREIFLHVVYGFLLIVSSSESSDAYSHSCVNFIDDRTFCERVHAKRAPTLARVKKANAKKQPCFIDKEKNPVAGVGGSATPFLKDGGLAPSMIRSSPRLAIHS
ncbi:unnamed protein product [Larinioides sclopetarius]|uniref:Secreted protein n=1 Tax=Larinioides sclopetarius TaxID=280406 RepID=A0AAV1YRS8_9ARAC